MTIEEKWQARFGEPMPVHIASLPPYLQERALKYAESNTLAVVPKPPVRQSEQSSLEDWDYSDQRANNAYGSDS
jgi:hypothetical protein